MKESGEMYLETIFMLSTKQDIIRAVDIAQSMSVSKPSVSKALSILKKDGYLVISSDGFIALTEKGRTVAYNISQRHQVLTDALCKLGVSKEQAEKDACRVEHYISQETFDKIQEHVIGKDN